MRSRHRLLQGRAGINMGRWCSVELQSRRGHTGWMGEGSVEGGKGKKHTHMIAETKKGDTRMSG